LQVYNYYQTYKYRPCLSYYRSKQTSTLQAEIKAASLTDTLIIDEFLDIQEKQIEDEEDDILYSIVQIYRNNQAGEESDDKGDIEVIKISINKAIQALEILRLYKMQQEEGSMSTL
jgi:hypothetical protein